MLSVVQLCDSYQFDFLYCGEHNRELKTEEIVCINFRTRVIKSLLSLKSLALQGIRMRGFFVGMLYIECIVK